LSKIIEFRPGKVGLLGAALYSAAIIFLPYVQYRPNRILTGESYRLWILFPGPVWVTLLLLILPALFYAFLPAYSQTARPLSALAAAALVQGALAWESSFLTRGAGLARVSISSGFWLAAAGVFLMISDCKGIRWAVKQASILYIIVLVFFCALLLTGCFDSLSVMLEFYGRRETFFAQITRHLALVISSVGTAAVFGIPLAFFLFTRRRLEHIVFFLVNMGQTIPTLSLLGLLMAPLAYLGSHSELLRAWGVSGIGFWPAWIALFLYAVFPILHNALAGLKMIDPAVTEAAASVGMTRRQIFFKVQIPLAVPLILGGIRTSLTQTMGNAILAALIGGGGLGSFIFLGLAQSAPDLIMLGVLPLVVLTFMADALLNRIVWLAAREIRNDQNTGADKIV
jgi:osmoprotectant transport system permease protein